ncbi:hypothetical protein [Muribacter muris]|nr:hypothetical protein [Muribacter muris]
MKDLEENVTIDDILNEYREALQAQANGIEHPLESIVCCTEGR